MPPATPVLTLARVSATSFSASISAGSVTAVHSVQYRALGASVDTLLGSVTGNGALPAPATGLSAHATYVAWAVGLEAGSYSLPHFSWVSLASPEDLLGAIHERWNGDPALVTQVTGGLWTGEVPEGTSYPYCWLELPDTTSHPNFANQIESANASFHCWAVGAEAASLCARRIKARFDWQALDAFGDSVCVSCTPLKQRITSEGLRDSQSRLVFRATLTYRFLVQRPR